MVAMRVFASSLRLTITRGLSGSGGVPSFFSGSDHVLTTAPAGVYSIKVLFPPPPTLSVLSWQARNKWPSRNARSSQFEAVAGLGAAIFVMVNPPGTDGAGAAKAPPAEVSTRITTAASVAADSRVIRDLTLALEN